MAYVYYPSSSIIYKRAVTNSNLIEEYIGVQPDTVIVLNGGTDFTSSLSASYSLTASYALNGGGSVGGPTLRAMTLCGGFTPSFLGADAVELPVPYSSDGTTPLAWNVKRLNLRVQLSGSITSSVDIEKSTSTGSFAGSLLGTLNLNSQSYETYIGSLQTVNSGDKLRFNVNTLGDAQYWTITCEIASI